AGRPDWVFVKLYSHGFFGWDQDAMIGGQMRRFMSEMLELSEKTKEFSVCFASAREAYNMVMAAADGHSGPTGRYRDYKLRQIMELQTSTDYVDFVASVSCVDELGFWSYYRLLGCV